MKTKRGVRVARATMGLWVTGALVCAFAAGAHAAGLYAYQFETKWPNVPEGWHFAGPVSAAVAPDGSVYVLDAAEDLVRRLDAAGNLMTEWGGSGSGNGQFDSASGISVASNGTVYVADTLNDRVQYFDPNGIFLGEWGTTGAGNGEFDSPHGVAIAPGGTVYVADTLNHRVQYFSASGAYQGQWGTSGSNNGEFSCPAAVAVAANGNVYVADTDNCRVQYFDAAGTYIGQWGTNGSGAGEFGEPEGIAVAADGTVYVADSGNCRVQYFGPAGTFQGVWGSRGYGDGQFAYPWGVAISTNGAVIYVCDTTNQRVQLFSSTGTYQGKWGSASNADGAFHMPWGIAQASNGNIYVTDSRNHRVQVFDSSGTFIRNWGEQGTGDGQFDTPAGVGVASDGSVYVTDRYNDRVQRFTPEGVYVSKWGSSGAGDGQFSAPIGVAVAADGTVYVADAGNDRVQYFDAAGGFQGKWGTSGFADGEFDTPHDVAVAGNGTVYVTDTFNDRIQRFDATGTYQGQWGNPGQGDGEFRGPHGISIAADGSLYVSDSLNSRIQHFAAAGGFLGKWGTPGTANGQFLGPAQVLAGADSRVYVADALANCVQKFQVVDQATTGALTVTIEPADARTGGAQWRVDGGPWQSSGETVQNLSAGQHTVSYKTLAGWSRPSEENVTIIAGQTATATGTYTQVTTGSLTVVIEPADARNAGARWRVDGGAWQVSGATVQNLSQGSHTVSYNTITGWTSPSDENVTINIGQTTTTTGTYTGSGPATASVTVNIEPADARTAGAQWRIDFGAWQASGATVQGLAPGSHTVSFSSISGWNTPADQTGSLAAGQTVTTTGTYTKAGPPAGSMKVILEPAAARNAGARWCVDGGDWQVSGATVENLAAGSHTVTCNAVANWTPPAPWSVTITADQTATVTRTYTQGAQPPGTCGSKSALAWLGGYVKEETLPLDVEGAQGATVAPDARLALRLAAEDAIVPESVWMLAEGDGWSCEVVQWRVTDAGDGRDGWAVVAPDTPMPLCAEVTVTAGAETVAGDTVGPMTYRFRVAEDGAGMPGDVRLEATVPPENLPAVMARAVGDAYRIVPEGVYDEAVDVMLPAPADADASMLSVYYWSDSVRHRGWYEAEHVQGWLDGVPELVKENGQTWLLLRVNHGGVVQLGQRLEANPGGLMPIVTTGGTGKWLVFLGCVAAVLVLLARAITLQRPGRQAN